MTTIQGIEVSWSRVRDLFALDYSVAQLNHGSYGAVPIPVQRVQQRVREEMEANPMAFFSRGLVDRLGHTRSHLAGFLGADPRSTAFVANATVAAQVVLGSLRFAAGDEILLTDHGYGAVRLAVDRVCARTGAVAREVAIPLPASDEEVVNRLTAVIRPGRTKLVIVDHITSPTAVVFPVARIAAAVRQFDIPVLVDAA
ncbi:MAG TPA: aminotransferase class V-fold PLP-dependent enzyme, partial [Micromonosporaceae bacterium]